MLILYHLSYIIYLSHISLGSTKSTGFCQRQSAQLRSFWAQSCASRAWRKFANASGSGKYPINNWKIIGTYGKNHGKSYWKIIGTSVENLCIFIEVAGKILELLVDVPCLPVGPQRCSKWWNTPEKICESPAANVQLSEGMRIYRS